jgi:transcriptional regulator with XRE-family HTH domain
VQFAKHLLYGLPYFMPPKESEKLIADLKAWCGERGEHYGRRAEIARKLGVSRGLVGDWLSGRAVPRLDVGLKLKAFLARRKRQKP